MSKRYPWTKLKDEEILSWRICDLNLTIKGTELEALTKQLYAELRNKDQKFLPACYLADEWFVEEGKSAIAIAFYLAHPRLKRIEKKFMLDIEGGTKSECMQLLRHECGHSYMYAYKLNRRKDFKEIFGSSDEEYKDTYRPKPYSKSYVRHLGSWYAQSHPDEDFAETFAVWLTPRANWRLRYKGWKALSKLEYIDNLMKEISELPPPKTSSRRYLSVDRLSRKLTNHYAMRQKEVAEEFPNFWDPDLQKLFPALRDGSNSEPATRFLKRHKKQVIETVGRWTGCRRYDVADLLERLIDRCRENKMRTEIEATGTLIDITAYLSTLITNYLNTGKYKRSK